MIFMTLEEGFVVRFALDFVGYFLQNKKHKPKASNPLTRLEGFEPSTSSLGGKRSNPD